jgi:tetratricopeptide (TPR) repeat protein
MRFALTVALAVSTLAVPAYAQAPSPTANTSALAEQLFSQARDLAAANRWAEACPKFEASLRYDPALGTRLNLALCYERVGKLATAWGIYRESLELARKAGDTKRADYALHQSTALEPRLPKLAITAPPAPPDGLVVKRDNTTISAAELGVALYVDPGEHTVTASAPGFDDFTLTITVREGKTETLALPKLPAKQAAVTTTDPQVDTPAPDTSVRTGRTRRYVAIGGAAVGVVAVSLGLVFGAKASSTYGDAKALCNPELVCDSTADYDRARELMSDARSAARTSTVLVVAGGAAIATGAIVFFTSPRAKARRARIMPVPQDGGAGLAVMGEF